MIPEDVNIGEIVASLKSDAVYVPTAFTSKTTDATPKELKAELSATVEDLSHGEEAEALGDIKIVALDKELGATQLRDIAQAVKDQTGANTVVAQSPSLSSTVSDEISRYSIEKNQQLVGGYSTVGETQEFLTVIAQPESHTLVNASGLTATLLAVAVSAWAAKKFYLHA